MCMLAIDNIGEQLTDLEKLCVILACAIHDVGHPGVNNDFLVKTGDPEALIYNDTSVNENMHVRVAFEILQLKECNILEGAFDQPRPVVLLQTIHHLRHSGNYYFYYQKIKLTGSKQWCIFSFAIMG